MFDDLVRQEREKGDFPSFFFSAAPALLCWQMVRFERGDLLYTPVYWELT